MRSLILLLLFTQFSFGQTFSVSITASRGGSVSTEGGVYDQGTIVTFTATPNAEGFYFAYWWDSGRRRVISRNSTAQVNYEATIQAIFIYEFFDWNGTNYYSRRTGGLSYVVIGDLSEQLDSLYHAKDIILSTGGRYNPIVDEDVGQTILDMNDLRVYEGWYDSIEVTIRYNRNPYYLYELLGQRYNMRSFRNQFEGRDYNINLYVNTHRNHLGQLTPIKVLRGSINYIE